MNVLLAEQIRAAKAQRDAKVRQAEEHPLVEANEQARAPPTPSEREPAPSGDVVATESTSTVQPNTVALETIPTVDPSAQLAKYKRMLRVGVDVNSVLRKMGEEAFDIALFDDEFAPTAVEAFYRPAYMAATQSMAVDSGSAAVDTIAHMEGTGHVSSPKSVRKKIHLPVIAKSKTTLRVASDDCTTTLWSRECSEAVAARVSPETRAAFNALFTKAVGKKAAPSSSSSCSSGKTKKPTSNSPHASALIDKGRAQNIAILLVGMKLLTDEWRECVLSMSFNENFSENLKMLMLAWPTSDEERAIQVYDADCGEKLGRAEEFLVGLRDIPRLKQKIECLHFRLLFSTRVFELRESMMLVVRGINQIIEKQTFAAAMQHIFRLCCVLNDGDDASDAKTNAKGFRMSALTQLLCARSFDPAVSVLGAIAQAIERDDPRLGTFAQELTLLTKCAAVSVGSLRSELASLEVGYQKLVDETKKAETINLASTMNPKLVEDLRNFHAIINNFTAEAELELRGLQLTMRDVTDACCRLNSYLEESDTTPFNDVITHIAAFVEAYSVERAKIVPVAHEAFSRSSSSSVASEEDCFFSPPSSQTSASTLCGSEGDNEVV